ncbi:hypothetical protein DQ04_13761010 [Trypanosoma grayi]|uniref:hypothetical protein n=1 Tax=Trypanosoma grayi TaxID=71804 RepID=UPI0004F424D6|nr:hypothetical protein DQ04_13761010 [Trypanosoma grayi]KEG06471.1 hypothetical protein DQ04_13761010 [Trypanosoma grayi]
MVWVESGVLGVEDARDKDGEEAVIVTLTSLSSMIIGGESGEKCSCGRRGFHADKPRGGVSRGEVRREELATCISKEQQR